MMRWADSKNIKGQDSKDYQLSLWVENRLDILKAKEHIAKDKFMTTGEGPNFEVVENFQQWLECVEYGVDSYV